MIKHVVGLKRLTRYLCWVLVANLGSVALAQVDVATVMRSDALPTPEQLTQLPGVLPEKATALIKEVKVPEGCDATSFATPLTGPVATGRKEFRSRIMNRFSWPVCSPAGAILQNNNPTRFPIARKAMRESRGLFAASGNFVPLLHSTAQPAEPPVTQITSMPRSM